MKVILLEQIPGLGELGAVVRVKDGFARNFLFPRRKADRATKPAIAEFERRRAELEERQRTQIAALESARAALDGGKIRLSAKAGPDGGLYGSVTAAMVAAAVNRMKPKGVADIAKGQVHMPHGHLKQLGESEVEVLLRPDLRAKMTVEVAAESEENAGAPLSDILPPDAGENKLKDAVLAAAESAKAAKAESSAPPAKTDDKSEKEQEQQK